MNEALSRTLLSSIIMPEIQEQLEKHRLKLDYSDSHCVLFKNNDNMKVMIELYSITSYRVTINDKDVAVNIGKEQIKNFIQ